MPVQVMSIVEKQELSIKILKIVISKKKNLKNEQRKYHRWTTFHIDVVNNSMVDLQKLLIPFPLRLV